MAKQLDITISDTAFSNCKRVGEDTRMKFKALVLRETANAWYVQIEDCEFPCFRWVSKFWVTAVSIFGSEYVSVEVPKAKANNWLVGAM